MFYTPHGYSFLMENYKPMKRRMFNGSTWNQSDSAIRSYFIENGLIECVIALPARLFAGITIATSMIVFSRNNKGVRLVDASELFVEGRRVNELSAENISLIIKATNGNLYIIELDEEKADPYYLAAFFGSEQGTAALRSITVGATIPNIGVEQLTKLVIPIPPIEKQKEIADKYKTVKDEITMLQLKLEKAKNRMAHIIEEGGANNA